MTVVFRLAQVCPEAMRIDSLAMWLAGKWMGKSRSQSMKTSALQAIVCVLAAAACSCAGCHDPVLPSVEPATFHRASPFAPETDLGDLKPVRCHTGPYRVVPGDLLSLTIPSMAASATGEEPTEVVLRRVGEDGKIVLPSVHEVAVADKTLTQVEGAIADAYFPAQLVYKPAVVAQVTEYRTVGATITGSVVTPGRHQLRSDELSLVALLAKAGGIAPSGAQAVLVTPCGDDAKTTILPIEHMNSPSVDVALQGGERVEVVKLRPQSVTVLGLVKNPGSYPVPPDSQINLAQALGLAGGVDPTTDPRFVTIYRLDKKGEVVWNRIELNAVWGDKKIFTDSSLSTAAFTPIKPGDVVMVEHTNRTRTRIAVNWLFNTFLAGYGGLGTQGTR